MQREHLISDDVNVEARANRARERTNGTGRLQRVEHFPQSSNAESVTLWQRVKSLFPHPEEITVAAGKVVQKGIVLTPTMCLALVLAIAGMVGGMYWRMDGRIEAKDQAYQEQRDMLIEIKTELKIAKEHEIEARQRLERQIGDLAAWQQVTNKDLARILPNRRN